MKVSLIIPVYNVEPYLDRCLNSVVSQTYSDIEIIIINDGSKDNSLNICQDYEKKDDRVILISQENKGLSAARNRGLNIASGEIIMFLDSDDWIHKQLVDSVVNTFFKDNCDIVSFGIKEVYSDNIIHDSQFEKCETLLFNKNEALKSLFNNEVIRFEVWNKAYKKEIINNIAFIEGQIHEDVYYTINCLLNCHKLVHLNTPLYYYYKGRNTNIGSSIISNRRLDIFREFIRLYKLNSLVVFKFDIAKMICDYAIAFFVNGKLFYGFTDNSEKDIINYFNYYYKLVCADKNKLSLRFILKYKLFYYSKSLYLIYFKVINNLKKN